MSSPCGPHLTSAKKAAEPVRLIERSPHTQLPLSRSLLSRSEHFDVASDWHLPMSEQVVERVVATLAANQRGEIFICAGDVFDASERQDTSGWTSHMLSALARVYSLVLYTPGNHCLRSKREPWASFRFPENVKMPVADQPLLVTTARNKILLGNCFYDFELVPPQSVGFTAAQIRDFYATSNDGRSLCDGKTDLFKSMAINLARAVTPEVSMLITHTLPHPAAVAFRVNEKTARQEELERRLGVPFICNPADDAVEAAIEGVTSQEFRDFWNKKSFVMGSNILNHQEADPADGLIAVYGHNHRGSDMRVRAENGSEIHLVTHQPYCPYPKEWQSV